MFKALKDKLRIFQKKVSEEAVEEKETLYSATENVSAESSRQAPMLQSITYKLQSKKIDDILWALELILLESDVALPVVERIKEDVKQELQNQQITRNIKSVVESALKNAISNILCSSSCNFEELITKKEKPVKLMFVGINGSGKTTAIAKIAYLLKKKRYSCVIAASDTFRAGAIEQLEKHAEMLDVKLIRHQSGSDPAAVAYDAVEHAKARKKDFVLIDTAGRMQTNVNLMDEMKKIKRVIEPDMIIFVGDALTGNDAVEQARIFNDAIGIDAVILTKIDADAKGGSALSVAYTIGKPILFLSTGQKYEEIIPFDPKWMVERLFE